MPLPHATSVEVCRAPHAAPSRRHSRHLHGRRLVALDKETAQATTQNDKINTTLQGPGSIFEAAIRKLSLTAWLANGHATSPQGQPNCN